jgi:dienelactone hydrolase
MPDFFDGKPADISWYPPGDDKDKQAKLGEFFKTQGAPPKTLERIPKVIEELKKSKGVEKWAILGFCWGGKIVNLSSQEGSLFEVAAAAHPAMVAAEDAKATTIPYIMLPSEEEPKDDVEEWQKNIKTANVVEWFPDQVRRPKANCAWYSRLTMNRYTDGWQREATLKMRKSRRHTKRDTSWCWTSSTSTCEWRVSPVEQRDVTEAFRTSYTKL